MTKSRTKKQLKQLIEQQAEERHARYWKRSMNKRGVHNPIYKLKTPTPIQLSASDDQSDQESDQDYDRVHSSTKTKKNRPNIARISLNAVNFGAPDRKASNMAQALGGNMMDNLDYGAPENFGDDRSWDEANIERAKHGGTRRKRNRNNASKRLRKRKHHGKTLRRK